MKEIIKVIKIKEHRIKAIIQIESVTIVRYFKTAIEFTRYTRNNRIKKIIAYTRNY